MGEKKTVGKTLQNICGKLCLPVLIIIIICMLFAVFTADSSQRGKQTASEISTTKETTAYETIVTETTVTRAETETLSETAFASSKKDDISAPYAGLYEASTLRAIYEKQSQEEIYPASLTKILTAVTALTYVPSDTVFTVGSEQDLVPKHSSLCLIKKGHRLTLYDLLTGILIASGGDAAYTVAVNTARFVMNRNDVSDEEALSYFTTLMNTSATQAGAFNSHFINPDGFDSDTQYTTIRDLAAVCRYALSFDEIKDIVACSEKYVVFESGQTVIWKNSNQLLNSKSPYYFPEAIGMKTGTTPLAGKCLIAVADINGKTYIAVVAGCDSEESRYNSALSLFEIVAPI